MRKIKGNGHDAGKRAAAATAPRFDLPQEGELTGAADGRKRGGGSWVPVEGPFLRRVAKTAPNRTGVVGISYGHVSNGAGRRRYKVFYVQLGRKKRKFNITTLGKEVAWERALRCRAEHERRVRDANARIRAARQKTEVA